MRRIRSFVNRRPASAFVVLMIAGLSASGASPLPYLFRDAVVYTLQLDLEAVLTVMLIATAVYCLRRQIFCLHEEQHRKQRGNPFAAIKKPPKARIANEPQQRDR
jgi:hypothetical protein